MYTRVRHFFWKIQLGGHFIALGQGISKLFLFFFWDLYFLNILTSKFGIPCSKVEKIFFFKYSLLTVQKTRIETLNTNIESFFKKIEAQVDKKLYNSEIFQKAWFFACQSNLFSHFWKLIRYLSSVFQYASFDTSQDYIWKKNSKILLHGIPNFEVKILEKYTSQKKNNNSSKNPWPRALKCPWNWNFMKPVLRSRKKCRTLI